MTYRLPPLNALRAFEAAARHLSFKTAAAELHVTPGAVSQQVRALERLLDVALFDRVHQGLVLTEAGQRYLVPLRSAFDTISIATQSVAPRRSGSEFVIATAPDFAVHWLLPALDGFHDAHPGIRLKIAEADGPDSVVRGRAQIALLSGVSSHPDLTATEIVADRRFPAIAAGPRPDRSPADGPLLVAGDEGLWQRVLAATDTPDLERLDRVAFEGRDLAVRAAELGRGVVLASTVHDRAALDAGRLMPSGRGGDVIAARWYALCPPGRLACPEEGTVLGWLVEAGLPAGEQVVGGQVTAARTA